MQVRKKIIKKTLNKRKQLKPPSLSASRKIKGDDLGLSLPTEYTTPSENLSDYSILLYGRKKIGKTTLAAQFAKESKTFFMFTETGGKALSLYARLVTKWEEAMGYLQLLEEDQRFDQVVIDIADVIYDYCMEFICSMKGIEHPQDEGYGKAWNALKTEFSGWIRRILNLNKGVIFISHDRLREIESFNGTKYEKIVPTLSGQAEDVISGLVDMWFYYTYWGEERVLVIEGDDHIEAGRRVLKNRFYTPSGDRLKMIPMGNSPEESYENFLLAWNNEFIPENNDFIKEVSKKSKLVLSKRNKNNKNSGNNQSQKNIKFKI